MRCRYSVSLVAVLLLSACVGVPQSQSALSAPGEAAYDPRLSGVWFGVLGGSGTETVVAQLEVAPREDGLVSVVGLWSEAGASPDREADWVRWLGAVAHASELDGRTYYNLRLVSGNLNILRDIAPEESGEPPSYVIVQAEVDADDRLYLRVMSPKAVGRMVENDSVRGRVVNCGDYCGYHRLELSREELIAMFRQAARDELFTSALGPFHRVGPGTPVIDFDAWIEDWRDVMGWGPDSPELPP
jgi:hypothetical protein